MRLASKAVVSTFALLLSAGISLAGTIKGTVMDKDGKPAASVDVRLVKGGMGKKEKAPETLADKEKKKEKGEKKGGMEALMTTKTDSEGKFEFKEVPEGSYNVMAGNREMGMGRAMAKVTGDETTEVKVELKEAKAKGE